MTKFIAMSRAAALIAVGVAFAGTVHAETLIRDHGGAPQVQAADEPIVRDHRKRPIVRDHRKKPKIGFCFGGLFGGTTCY